MTLSGATTPSQSRPGSNGIEGVLCILQSPSITGISPPDCLISYPGHLLVGGVLPLCRDAIGVFYSPSQLSNQEKVLWNKTYSLHRFPAFLESLILLKNWCSIHARCTKSSLKHSTRFCGIFYKFKIEFYCILFF